MVRGNHPVQHTADTGVAVTPEASLATLGAPSPQLLASGCGVLQSPRSDGKAAGTQSGHWAPRRPWSPACAFPSDWPTRVA